MEILNQNQSQLAVWKWPVSFWRGHIMSSLHCEPPHWLLHDGLRLASSSTKPRVCKGSHQFWNFFFMKSLHEMVTPPHPVPLLWSPYIFIFPTIFWAKKKMILRVVWGVLMGVLGVFEGCCRVFEVCLKGVWKNKIEVWNQSEPPTPFTKLFHKKSFFLHEWLLP